MNDSVDDERRSASRAWIGVLLFPLGKDWARPGYARYLTYRDERGTIPQSGEEGR
jgi:hypothetical protein